MVKQNELNSRNRNLSRGNMPPPISKSADSPEDELINSLSNKRENRRAKQTWEWEQVRRNLTKLRDIA